MSLSVQDTMSSPNGLSKNCVNGSDRQKFCKEIKQIVHWKNSMFFVSRMDKFERLEIVAIQGYLLQS